MVRYMNHIALCQRRDPAAGRGRRPLRRLPRDNFIDEHVWEKLQLGIMPSAPADDRTLPAPGLSRRHRSPAHAGRGPRLFSTIRDPPRPRQTDRSSAPTARVRRPLGEQVGGPAASQPVPRRHQGGAELRRLDSRRLSAEPAVRPVRPRAGHGPGQHLAQRGGHVVSRPPFAREITTHGQSAVPGHPAGMCQVPSSSVRGVGPGRLLQFRRVLRPSRRARALGCRRRSPAAKRSSSWAARRSSTSADRRSAGAATAVRRGTGKDDRRMPRAALADWITRDDNEFFAQMHRQSRLGRLSWGSGWSSRWTTCGRRIRRPIEPLLDALGRHLRQHGYDLKQLIRTISTSYVYGLSSLSSDERRPTRGQLLAALPPAIAGRSAAGRGRRYHGRADRFAAMPPGSRPIQFWTHRVGSIFPRHLRPSGRESGPALRARAKRPSRRRCT